MAERFALNKRCAENLERARGAAAFRNICSFQKTHAWINSRAIERRHVGGWHHPRQTGLIEPHRAVPVFHWQDRQSTFRKSLVSKLPREFADCFSMTHRDRMKTDERFVIQIKQRSL